MMFAFGAEGRTRLGLTVPSGEGEGEDELGRHCTRREPSSRHLRAGGERFAGAPATLFVEPWIVCKKDTKVKATDTNIMGA